MAKESLMRLYIRWLKKNQGRLRPQKFTLYSMYFKDWHKTEERLKDVRETLEDSSRRHQGR